MADPREAAQHPGEQASTAVLDRQAETPSILDELDSAEPAAADKTASASGTAPAAETTATPDSATGSADMAADDAGQTTIDGGAEAAKPKRGRPRRQQAGKSRGPELMVTITGSSDGTDWRAEVTHAGQVVVGDLAIPATAVSAAAKDLHPQVAETIEGVLETAREQHRSRVEALQAQLEAARQALADLEE